MQFHSQLFGLIPAVRYVATKQGNKLELNQRETLVDASDSESDKYEELIVNPAILQLAKSRGDIDCGGLDYVVIGYGSFFQYVQAIDKGHISIAIERSADLNVTIEQISSIVNSAFSKPKPN